MLKAAARGRDGRTVVLIGLSHRNLDLLRERGMNGHIRIKGEDVGIGAADVLIFAGESEMQMVRELESLIGPQTDVVDVKRLRD